MKQVIIVRSDLKMGKGKLAAQCAHASVASMDKASRTKNELWKLAGMKKVIVKVSSLTELQSLKKKADSLHIPNALITDAGHTQLEPGTVTVLGIGPDDDEKIDKVTGNLPLLG